MVIHNHPYYGSSHSPDIAVVIPVFHKGELVAYSANTVHHLDIGAATPGLIIDIPDVYAEGMLFAGTKLYEEGRRNEALWEYIRRNSRAARQLQDDLDAQIASARLGVRRFNELLERYGMDTVLTATHQLMDYTERVLRQRIAEIPDGEYRAEGFLDDDGRNRDVRLPIKVCVRVKGDGIEIDLTGSADQVETGFNVPFEGSTKVACFCAIRSLLLDAETSEIKVPSNQGSFRPISVIAPNRRAVGDLRRRRRTVRRSRDLQRRPAGRHHQHAGEVRRAESVGGRRDGVLRPCGGGLTKTRSNGRPRRCWRTCSTISAPWSMRGMRTGWWWTSIPRPSTFRPPRRCDRGCGPTRGAENHALRRLTGMGTAPGCSAPAPRTATAACRSGRRSKSRPKRRSGRAPRRCWRCRIGLGATAGTFGTVEDRPPHVDKGSGLGSKLEPTTAILCRQRRSMGCSSCP